MNSRRRVTGLCSLFSALFLIMVCAAPIQAAEHSAEELAKAAQNPVANLISVPFQNNVNFNVGPLNNVQNILNIQPVIPVSLGPSWNLITRTIMPVISQPPFAPGQDTQFGLGDIQFTAFLSPAKPGEFIWGVGPIVQLPSHTDNRLGSRQWGLGPSVVVLRLHLANHDRCGLPNQQSYRRCCGISVSVLEVRRQ